MIKVLTFFYRSCNYGGTLQAYALCKFLNNQNFLCEQICYQQSSNTSRSSTFNKIRTTSLKKVFTKLRSLIDKTLFNLLVKDGKLRKTNFFNFQNQYIPHTKKVYTDDDISLSVKEGDIVIVGSDQVWNPFWTNNRYFLDFVPETCGKIAYSASFGVSRLDEELFREKFALLQCFNFISVREKKAVELLSKNIKKDTWLVADPTLLLEAREWDNLAILPSINEKYIFVYLLGNDANQRKIVKKISRILGLKVVFVPHVHFTYNYRDLGISDYHIDSAGPQEFLGLIKNAELIITDSFHGCVFSIIFQKNFWTFQRHSKTDPENMNSRLDTLFDIFGIEDRFIKKDSMISEEKLMQPLDYQKITKLLHEFKKYSETLLVEAINSAIASLEATQFSESKNKDKTF